MFLADFQLVENQQEINLCGSAAPRETHFNEQSLSNPYTFTPFQPLHLYY